MRLLMIAKNLPPVPDPEALCTAKLLEGMHRCGLSVEVLTATPQPEALASKWHIVEEHGKERFPERIRRNLARYPEGGWDWAKAAARRIRRLHATQPFDAVYSRGMPFVSHLAAWRSGLPVNVAIVAHFSDPWPQTDFWADPGGRRLWWHRRLIPSFTAMTYSSLRVQRVCREQHWNQLPLVLPPSLVLPHAGRDLRLAEPESLSGHEVLRFLHCGSLHGPRKPDYLLAALARLVTVRPELRSRIRIEQVGPFSAALAEQAQVHKVADLVTQHGPCNYAASLEHMKNADVLLLVENAEEREGVYLPSKFVDYLWAGRPIIALTPQNGTVSDYLGPDYRLRADPWEAGSIEKVLEATITDQNELTSATEILIRLRSQFDPKQVGHHLSEFLRSCMPQS